MANDMKIFLNHKFDEESTSCILENYSKLLSKMYSEQEHILSTRQFKLAKNRILIRIAFYLSIKKYVNDLDALSYAKEYFYAKVQSAAKFIQGLSKSDFGCVLFQKSFSNGLKADTWVSEIKQNDKNALVYDITKCLYKDLCDFYKCPELCVLFCDGDWLMFGKMKKIKFEREYTLGQGNELCDFKFTRRAIE